MPSSLPERTLIWCEIKAAVPVMLKNGVSSVGVLVWSQGKSLKEVVEVTSLLRGILNKTNKNNETFTMNYAIFHFPLSLS